MYIIYATNGCVGTYEHIKWNITWNIVKIYIYITKVCQTVYYMNEHFNYIKIVTNWIKILIS